MSVKLLFVIGSLDVGGAERQLVQLLPCLASQGFELTVFTLVHKGKLAPELERCGVKVVQPFFAKRLRQFPLILRRPLLSLSAFLSYLFFLLRWRPVIIHFFLPAAYLFGGICSLMLGKRILLMSRRSLNRYQLSYPLLAQVERWLHRRMNAVLGNSKAVLRDLRGEGIDEIRLGLIYNGIDIESVRNLDSRESIRRALGVDEHVFFIVCVANLHPYKGHLDLINALGQVNDALPEDWVIAMVGRDTGIEGELRSFANYHGIAEHILWLGERDDTISIYSAADLGVLSSHQEGFSNSLLEGMAVNLAMVVTDVGGNSEAVIDGVCGIVVPPKAPQLLGKAILSLAKDEQIRLRMSLLAGQRVRREFGLESCVKRYVHLYHSLLKYQDFEVQKAIDVGLIDYMD